MILEVAVLNIVPGEELAFEEAIRTAKPLITATPGFGSIRIHRCIETPNRYLSTLFGTMTLWRYWYRPEAGGTGIFPLEIQLGLECGLATPALAERVAQYTVDSTQLHFRRS